MANTPKEVHVTIIHPDFRAIRASAPVVGMGEKHSDFCVFALDLGNNEYFVFRDVFAHIEIVDSEKVVYVPGRNGVRGLLQCIVEHKTDRPRKLTEHPVRLPSFNDWWDGTDEKLHTLMLLLVKSDHDVIESLVNIAQAIRGQEVADRVVQDTSLPASTRFAALHATETEASIQSLCSFVNGHGGFARELHVRLEHADPLIQLLARRGELERIRPAIEQVPKVFEWWNKYSGTSLLEALRVLTGTTR
ncbi:MAG: hypothetical protein AAB473_05500 [Patescibacteria group bacterium]